MRIRGSTATYNAEAPPFVKSTSGSEPNSIPALNYVLILGVEEIVTMTSMLLPLNDLGAIEHNGAITFGLWLPWVSAADGNAITVKVIHEHDQFQQRIEPRILHDA